MNLSSVSPVSFSSSKTLTVSGVKIDLRGLQVRNAEVRTVVRIIVDGVASGETTRNIIWSIDKALGRVVGFEDIACVGTQAFRHLGRMR